MIGDLWGRIREIARRCKSDGRMQRDTPWSTMETVTTILLIVLVVALYRSLSTLR